MKHILEKLYIFEWFDSALLNEIEKKWEIIKFKTGDIIIKEWERADSAYILISWIVKVSKNWKEISNIFEGDIFWEIALVTNEPRTATISAQDDVEVLKIDKKTLISIIKHIPNWEIIKNTILNRIIQNNKL